MPFLLQGSKRILQNPFKSSLHSYLPNYPVNAEPKPQMTARVALAYFKNELTDYEKTEILDYTDVYYLGRLNNKIKPNPIGINSGFDDERGDYLLVAGDHIAYRYEILKMLGKGNFGQVALCEDHKRHEKIALKDRPQQEKIQPAGHCGNKDPADSAGKRYRQQVPRGENKKLLRVPQTHLHDLRPTEHEPLRVAAPEQLRGLFPGPDPQVRLPVAGLFDYTYKFDIIHCDLKPENIMLVTQDKAEINVIDFGSSCVESERLYTYIQSRFYRAPEIILGIPYTPAIDMWSVGCILAEFYTGYPLFTGESEHDQLVHIMEVLGTPGERVMSDPPGRNCFLKAMGVRRC